MKKAEYNSKGTKQIVHTGYKLFDKQTNCITRGCAICNTQYSTYITPWTETKCNNSTFEEGYLLKANLGWFGRHKDRIPKKIMDKIMDKERKEYVILYMFHTYDKSGSIEPFGWLLTDYHHKLIADAVTYNYGQSWMKRFNALKEIEEYIIAD